MSKFTQIVSAFARRATNKQRSQESLSRNNLVAIFAVVIVLLGAAYFIQVNLSTTRSFALQGLLQKQASLQQQKRDLELQQAQLTALSTLQDTPAVSQLVASTNVQYLEPALSDVARR